jgi:hypothetical protein
MCLDLLNHCKWHPWLEKGDGKDVPSPPPPPLPDLPHMMLNLPTDTSVGGLV